LLDWIVRSKEDALAGDAPKERFTRDFHGQIRQLTFNARVRAEVLGLLDARPRGAPPSNTTVPIDRRGASSAAPPPAAAPPASPAPVDVAPSDAPPSDADPADLGF